MSPGSRSASRPCSRRSTIESLFFAEDTSSEVSGQRTRPATPLPGECCAPETMHDAHAASSGVFQERLKRGAGHIAAHPKFAHAEILEHGAQSAEVVLMGVGERDHVESLQPAIPQVLRDNLLADINSRARAAADA